MIDLNIRADLGDRQYARSEGIASVNGKIDTVAIRAEGEVLDDHPHTDRGQDEVLAAIQDHGQARRGSANDVIPRSGIDRTACEAVHRDVVVSSATLDRDNSGTGESDGVVAQAAAGYGRTRAVGNRDPVIAVATAQVIATGAAVYDVVPRAAIYHVREQGAVQDVRICAANERGGRRIFHENQASVGQHAEVAVERIDDQAITGVYTADRAGPLANVGVDGNAGDDPPVRHPQLHDGICFAVENKKMLAAGVESKVRDPPLSPNAAGGRGQGN